MRPSLVFYGTIIGSNLIGLIVGGICFTLLKADSSLSILIGLTTAIFVQIITLDLKGDGRHGQILERQQEILSRLSTISTCASLASHLVQQRHAYFDAIVKRRLQRFLDDNATLFAGEHRTDPGSEDTFGIDGLYYTAKSGSLKCLSSIPGYWSDPRNRVKGRVSAYLQVQKHLIETKNVAVERIFCFPSTEHKAFVPIMREQVKLGISVYYVHSDTCTSIEPSWLTEDYQIQDNALLVDLQRNSSERPGLADATEVITTNKSTVEERSVRFAHIKARAIRFTS